MNGNMYILFFFFLLARPSSLSFTISRTQNKSAFVLTGRVFLGGLWYKVWNHVTVDEMKRRAREVKHCARNAWSLRVSVEAFVPLLAPVVSIGGKDKRFFFFSFQSTAICREHLSSFFFGALPVAPCAP